MRKTTVYLTDGEADALRMASELTGRSQSEIIREGVRLATSKSKGARRFRSMGIAEGSGEAVGRRSEEILERELGLGR